MYSLRALPMDGRCPECGTPVVESVTDGILARCAPAEIRRTAGAMRFVLWATLGFVAAAAFGNLARLTPVASVDALVRHARIQMSIELLAGLVLAAAHWQLGRPIPGCGNHVSGVRREYRASVAGVVIVQLAVIAMRVASPFPLAGPGRTALQLATWVGNVAFALAVVTFLAYARELASRVPNERLVKSARQLFWLCVTALTSFQSLALRAILVPPQNVSRSFIVAIVVTTLSAGIFLMGAAGAMVLLHRLRVWFTRAANASSVSANP
jgi:hypothetical protein